MIQARKLFLVCVLLPTVLYGAPPDRFKGARTQENLDRIVADLKSPEKRMAAVKELLDFAEHEAYPMTSMGEMYSDDLHRQAAQALKSAADNATVLQAIQSTDVVVVYWAFFNIHVIEDKRALDSILHKLALAGPDADEGIRARAVEFLVADKPFIATLVAQEKSPYVLHRALSSDSNKTFNTRLIDILKDPNPEVRQKVITYIGTNWMSAPSVQMFIDVPIMDALLARAKSAEPDAAPALDAFKTYANNPDLSDAASAAAWWPAHRSDWELARIPRWQKQNGHQIEPTIVTKGQGSDWQATITLTNRVNASVYLNLAEIPRPNWDLFDANGEHVMLVKYKSPKPLAPAWVELKTGESTPPQPASIDLSQYGPLPPGRYTLKAYIDIGSDTRSAPKGVPLYSSQLSLPSITIEIPAK